MGFFRFNNYYFKIAGKNETIVKNIFNIVIEASNQIGIKRFFYLLFAQRGMLVPPYQGSVYPVYRISEKEFNKKFSEYFNKPIKRNGSIANGYLAELKTDNKIVFWIKRIFKK